MFRNIISRFYCIVVFILSLGIIEIECGQLCLACSEMNNLKDCQQFVVCDNDQICYQHKYRTEQNQSRYDTGCSYPELCTKRHATGINLGKRTSQHSHIICQSCCNETLLCNRNIMCNSLTVAPSQSCLSCSGIADPASCKTTTQCLENEVCYLHKYRTNLNQDRYDVGCKHFAFCLHGQTNIFGRRSSSAHYMICDKCCSGTTNCNGELQCVHNNQKKYNDQCNSSDECTSSLFCDHGKCHCSNTTNWNGTFCIQRLGCPSYDGATCPADCQSYNMDFCPICDYSICSATKP